MVVLHVGLLLSPDPDLEQVGVPRVLANPGQL